MKKKQLKKEESLSILYTQRVKTNIHKKDLSKFNKMQKILISNDYIK